MPTVVQNPLADLSEGLLRGYTLAHQIKQQAMAEEAHQRNMAAMDRENQVRDIQTRMMLDQNARPVNAGAVTMPGNSAPLNVGGIDLGNIKAPDLVRPVDKARKVSYGGQDFELFTPEEQLQRQIDRSTKMQTGEALGQAQAGAAVRQQMLQQMGVDLPEEIAGPLYMPHGSKVLPNEIPGLAKEAAGVRKENRVTLAPGSKLVDFGPTGNGQAQTVAEAPPLEDAKTRAARNFTAEILGKKPDQVTAQELAKGVQQWELATMNPLDKSIKEEEVKTAPLNRAVKQSTLASQAIERQVKAQELELAGDPDTVNMAAQKYLQTGQMPALGMGSSLLRGKIMGRAAELAKENGLAPEQVPGLQDTYKSLSKALSDLQTKKGQIEAFEKGGAANLDNFIRLAKQQADLGSPLVNRAVRGAARTLTGSPDQAAADAARIAAFNEISKILSGSLGNSGVSDSARHEAESLLSGNYTMGQLAKVAEVLRQDMRNRTAAYGQQIDETRKQMQGLTSPKQAQTSVEKWDFDAKGNLVKVGSK